MKRVLLLAAIAALAVTSCAKEETITKVASGEAITFKSYTNGVTKASSVTTTSVEEETFELDSYQTVGYFSYADATANIPSETLAYSGSSWTVENIYFWPVYNEENTVYESFFAVNLEDVMDDVSDTQLFPSFDYTIATDAADMKDIIVANYMDKTEGSVNLNFYHSLAKLNFQAEGADDGGGEYNEDESLNTLVTYEYELLSLTVTGLYDTATFTFDGSDSACPGAWSAHSNIETSYEYALPEECTCENTDVITLKTTDDDAAGDNSLLIMPQTETAFTVTITYTVSNEDKQVYPTDGVSIATASVLISDLTFAANSSTLIKLIIPTPGDLIAYKVEVQDWDEEVDTSDYEPKDDVASDNEDTNPDEGM